MASSIARRHTWLGLGRGDRAAAHHGAQRVPSVDQRAAPRVDGHHRLGGPVDELVLELGRVEVGAVHAVRRDAAAVCEDEHLGRRLGVRRGRARRLQARGHNLRQLSSRNTDRRTRAHGVGAILALVRSASARLSSTTAQTAHESRQRDGHRRADSYSGEQRAAYSHVGRDVR
eukprot:scaffold4082_cov62-Phaeocystis_antarctica.AAC.10